MFFSFINGAAASQPCLHVADPFGLRPAWFGWNVVRSWRNINTWCSDLDLKACSCPLFACLWLTKLRSAWYNHLIWWSIPTKTNQLTNIVTLHCRATCLARCDSMWITYIYVIYVITTAAYLMPYVILAPWDIQESHLKISFGWSFQLLISFFLSFFLVFFQSVQTI